MAKKEVSFGTGRLHYANLAVMAEKIGDYEDAAKQWRRASNASLESGSIMLYEEAAKRCERKWREQTENAEHQSVGN